MLYYYPVSENIPYPGRDITLKNSGMGTQALNALMFFIVDNWCQGAEVGRILRADHSL